MVRAGRVRQNGCVVEQPPYVGRAAALERLAAALTETASGRGSTVLVAGEAGIGKTRLAAELTERARRQGCLVLAGRCIDLIGAGVPYLPVAEAFNWPNHPNWGGVDNSPTSSTFGKVTGKNDQRNLQLSLRYSF